MLSLLNSDGYNSPPPRHSMKLDDLFTSGKASSYLNVSSVKKTQSRVWNYDKRQLKLLMESHLKKDNHCLLHQETYQKILPPCSFPFFQAYMKQCGYFPNRVTLTKNNDTVMKSCQMTDFSKERILNYFHENINYIVTLGDSQANRLSWAIIRKHFPTIGISCQKLKGEPRGFKGRKGYFIDGDNQSHVASALIEPYRKCQTCTSFLVRCTLPLSQKYKRSKTFHFEYLSLIMRYSNVTMVNRKFCDSQPKGFSSVCPLNTQSEVIFKYYLKPKKPDVLILFTTFAHDAYQPFASTGPRLRDVNDLILQTMPPDSHVVWVPSSQSNCKMFGCDKTRKENIPLFNHALSEMLLELFQQRQIHFHGYMDIGNIGITKEKEWAADHTHYKPIYRYYETITATLIELLPTLGKQN